MSDGDPEVWNVALLRGSDLSLHKNLTEDQCRRMLKGVGAAPNPWSDSEILRKAKAAVSGDAGYYVDRQGNPSGTVFVVMTPSRYVVPPTVSYHTHPGGMILPSEDWERTISQPAYDRCEWWGSKGGTLEVYEKPDDYDAKLAKAMEAAALVLETNKEITEQRERKPPPKPDYDWMY